MRWTVNNGMEFSRRMDNRLGEKIKYNRRGEGSGERRTTVEEERSAIRISGN